MKRILEVREYDRICCNPAFQEEYTYLPRDIFHNLEEFIHEFNSREDQADILEFLKIGYRRNVGDVISVSSYVGLIQMKNGYQIQILPKIDFAEKEGDGNSHTKKIFLSMLKTMKDFPGKISTNANLNTEKMDLYEIFINMYLSEVRKLVKHGLRSAYMLQGDNLHYFKGKLDINEHLKRNMSHEERFYVRFDEFQQDRPENRLIKSTLIKLQTMSGSSENQKEIRQLLTSFDLVKPSRNYQKDLSRTVIDRTMKDYDNLVRWAKVILLDQSFTTFSGATKARALLFPMEKIFESYVAHELRKSLADLNWEISTQDKGFYLFDQPKRFALRPDIVITRKDKSLVILDTKWKSLVDRPGNNYGISQSDMYQMYAYAKKYHTSEIWLLYPVNEEMRGHDRIRFSDNEGIQVNLFFVDVADMENSMAELRERLEAGDEM